MMLNGMVELKRDLKLFYMKKMKIYALSSIFVGMALVIVGVVMHLLDMREGVVITYVGAFTMLAVALFLAVYIIAVTVKNVHKLRRM